MTRSVAVPTLTARQRAVALLVALVVFVGLAAVVVTMADIVEDDGQPTTVLLSGQATVPRGQVHDDVYVARGTVVVNGVVEDDVLVGSGRARVNGVVHGDVTVLRGDAVLGPDAQVGGDLRTSRPARIDGAADLRGTTGGITLPAALESVPGLVRLGAWLAAGLAVLAVALVLPGTVTAAARSGRGRPGRSTLLGAAALLVGPVVAGVLALSLLGGALALVLGAALVVGATVGAAVTAATVGQVLLPRRGGAALAVGWSLVGLVLGAALALSPVLAALGALAVMAFGLGALTLTRTAPPAPVGTATQDDPGPGGGDPEPTAGGPTEDAERPEPRILASLPILTQRHGLGADRTPVGQN